MQSEGVPQVESRIAALAAALDGRFGALEPWLAVPEALWTARPERGAWSVGEIVEHVTLMQRYVLLLVDKIGDRAQRRRVAGAPLPTTLDDLAELDRLARRDRRWPHPGHMTPSGSTDRARLAAELAEQRRRCLAWLARLPRGEGALHSMRMSLLGRRLDLYGFLRLIDAHLERHLAQLERSRARLRACGPDAPPGPPPAGP